MRKATGWSYYYYYYYYYYYLLLLLSLLMYVEDNIIKQRISYLRHYFVKQLPCFLIISLNSEI